MGRVIIHSGEFLQKYFKTEGDHIQVILWCKNLKNCKMAPPSITHGKVETFTSSHNATYLPSTSSVSISATATYFNILHGQSGIEFYGQEGAYMVDRQLRIEEWSVHNSNFSDAFINR